MNAKFANRLQDYLKSECSDYDMSFSWEWNEDCECCDVTISKILPGTKYLEQVGIYEGDFACLKCRLDMSELINKYGLNEE